MKCEDVQSKWELYINGKCSPDDEQEMEAHLQTCLQCEHLLNETLENQHTILQEQGMKKKSEDPLDDLPLEKQSRMIRKAKWKNRIKNALTVFGLFILVSIVSTMITGIYYLWGEDNSRGSIAIQTIRTATQMTMPNVYIAGTGLESNIFFTVDMKAHIEKQLGNETRRIGDLKGKMVLNRINVNREWTDGQYNDKLHFINPDTVKNQPNSDQEYYSRTSHDTWYALNILPEGTVSELAITFDKLYDIDDVYGILQDYDLNIPWYAIDTGKGTKEEYASPFLSAGQGIWGIHEHSLFDFSKHGGSIETKGDGVKRGEEFKKGLRFLANHEKLAKQYIWTIDKNVSLKDLYNYVDEHGVKTYGVVVTGPTKELLKLRDNKNIIYATLGEVDFWNWYTRPASGTIYN